MLAKCSEHDTFRHPCAAQLNSLHGLQLPLGLAHGPMRKQAINVLKALLAAGPDGGSSPVDAQYVGTALRRLTAQETVLLLEWADVSHDPTATWCAKDDPIWGAMAPRAQQHLATVRSSFPQCCC